MQALLSQQLQVAVQPLHQEALALPFVEALGRASLPLPSLLSQMRLFAMVLAFLRREVPLCQSSRLKEVWRQGDQRLPDLLGDLGRLARRPQPDVVPALDLGHDLLEWLGQIRRQTPLLLLGPLYVMEGTALGNCRHARQVAALAPALPGGGRFYSGGPGGPAAAFGNFLARLDATPLTTDERSAIQETALAAFRFLLEAHRALFPFKPKDLAYTATSVNPEAGRHAVPQDPVLLAATTAAGERCFSAFPYFAARFSDRGKAFLASDCAWLATLGGLSLPEVLSQIAQKAEALANLGVPSYALQRQLEYLYEELIAASPASSAGFRVLLQAARHMSDQSDRLLPPTARQNLLQRFAKQAPSQELAGFPGCGQLAISWVLDRSLGLGGEQESFRHWLLDKTRFSRVWLKAASQLLLDTQREMNPSS